MVLPTQDQTPQDPPTDATKSRRIRKVRRIDLKGCECGWEVSQAEIEAGDNVMRCKVQGCETVWFHRMCMDYDYVPKNWACHSCKASSTKRHRA